MLVPCRGLAVRQSTDMLAVDNPVLRKALGLLRATIENPPSTVQLAKSVGVSRATLDRLFSAELGRSIHDELLRLRIAKAKGMLSEGNGTVNEIAAACGFCNAGHFINVFRKAVNTTPAKWRTMAVS